MIHSLLSHLAARGIVAPRPLDISDDGREALLFIEGETSVPPYPDSWVREENTLVEVGRMLRALHDATEDFSGPHETDWSVALADPEGGDVICHNDVCIENVVFSEGRAVVLIDFDFAAPGRPVWDLAMTARFWVPLQDPISAAATAREHLDPITRVRLLADAYGADEAVRRKFTSVLLKIEEVALSFVLGNVEGAIRLRRDVGATRGYAET